MKRMARWVCALGIAFGYSPCFDELDGHPLAPGDGLTKVEFTMPSADAPLPEWVQFVEIGDEDYPLLSIDATAAAGQDAGSPHVVPS